MNLPEATNLPAQTPAPTENAPAANGTLLGGTAASAPAPAPAANPAASVAAAAPAAAEVPAVYDLKLPEGLEVEAGRLDSFKALCVAQKLSPEAAQALIDWQVADHTAENAAVDQQIAETSKAWHDSIRNDAELGGKNYAATEAACNRVVGKFFTPELKQLFNDSGLGNHPEVVRVFARIGAGLAEDRSIAPAAPAATQRRGLFDRSLA